MSDLDEELERADAEVRLAFTARIYQLRDRGLLTGEEADELTAWVEDGGDVERIQALMERAIERAKGPGVAPERRETA